MRDLEFAFDTSSDEVEHYVDVETGEILVVTPESSDIDPMDLELNERYVLIPALSSSEGYQEMEAFIRTVRDAQLREMLEIAIDGRGAFSRFNGVLARHPDVQQRWYSFRNGRLRDRITAWLESQNIALE